MSISLSSSQSVVLIPKSHRHQCFHAIPSKMGQQHILVLLRKG